MDDLEQHKNDRENPAPILLKLAKDTVVGNISMALEKIEQTYSTILSGNDTESLKVSKLGGIGYLPAGESYPKAKDKEPLVMLAQINFSEIEALSCDSSLPYRLPSTGILQIYIDGRSLTGLYGESGYQNNGMPSDSYQVKFWSDTSADVNMNELAARKDYLTGSAVNFDYGNKNFHHLPFKLGSEFSIEFSLSSQSCHPNCHEYTKLSDDKKLPSQEEFIANTELTDYALSIITMFEDSMELDYPENVTSYYFYEDMANIGGSHLLGYPNFDQTDPRSSNEHIKDFVLLMQIDSSTKGIMWGDCGQAQFFIHPDDLAQGDFSRLVYTWDCG